MYRGQFSQKKPNPVKTGTFKKGATASAPATKLTSKKVIKKMIKPKKHTNTINSLCIKRINYVEEEGEKVIHVYFYDNLYGMCLDYVAPANSTDTQDTLAQKTNIRPDLA